MPAIGRISGLCADYSKSTLNGRPYDKIYERILKGEDFRFNEMMKRGGIPCELGHPTDFDPQGNPRTETDPTKIAVILTDIKRGGPQQLVASGEIMDTPNGKIFKALSEHYNFGLSSRGSYEISEEDAMLGNVEGPDGWNQDSYVFKGYDLVLLPANPSSVLSVTEGMGTPNNKIMKVARESIDVNLLAKASQVSEDQVEQALDQLFKVDENAEKGEEIPIPEMKENMENENLENGVSPEEEGKPEEENQDSVEPTLIADGNEVEKIKADLQTALDEVKALMEGKEKDSIELSNRDAKILELTSDNENLRSELEERIAESEQFVEKFEALKEISAKLLESYKAAKEKFEAEGDKPSEREQQLEAELEKEKDEVGVAQESLSKERKISAALRTELASAKEALISAYARTYGVSMEAIKSSLGRNYSVRKILPAAEALANQTSRFTSIPAFQVVKQRSSATESLQAGDEIERELIDLIKNK